jgi:hypothetical protein
MTRGKSTGGNVLFLILIAVALFAALSYVITQSTRSGGGSMDREWIKMTQAQIDNISLTLSSTIIRHQFKTKCKLIDILDNYCPPTTAPATCAAVARPECNIFNINSSDRPPLNWVPGTGPSHIQLTGGGGQNNIVRVYMWGGSAISTDAVIVLAAFEVEDSATYENFAKWRTLCIETNQKAGLPAPDVVAAMAANVKSDLYYDNGMNGAICELDLSATPDLIKLSTPLAQFGY